MSGMEPGAMAAVFAPPDRVQTAVDVRNATADGLAVNISADNGGAPGDQRPGGGNRGGLRAIGVRGVPGEAAEYGQGVPQCPGRADSRGAGSVTQRYGDLPAHSHGREQPDRPGCGAGPDARRRVLEAARPAGRAIRWRRQDIGGVRGGPGHRDRSAPGAGAHGPVRLARVSRHTCATCVVEPAAAVCRCAGDAECGRLHSGRRGGVRGGSSGSLRGIVRRRITAADLAPELPLPAHAPLAGRAEAAARPGPDILYWETATNPRAARSPSRPSCSRRTPSGWTIIAFSTGSSLPARSTARWRRPRPASRAAGRLSWRTSSSITHWSSPARMRRAATATRAAGFSWCSDESGEPFASGPDVQQGK